MTFTAKITFGLTLMCSSISFGLTCSKFVDHNLERLVDEAELVLMDGKKDAELAALITSVANEGIDVANMTSLQLEAFKIASLIKPPPRKEWVSGTRYRKNPKTVELGAFPERGIDFVRAHIIMRELKLNDKTQERLVGVTFEISLSEGDARSTDLDKITEAKIKTWTKANSHQAYRRRKHLTHILRESFDHLAKKENKRLIHSVTSLSRNSSTTMGYTFPRTDLDPVVYIRERRPEQVHELSAYLSNLFLAVLSGENDVTVLNGYQNGNTANPARGRH